jgi:hypothetical protein
MQIWPLFQLDDGRTQGWEKMIRNWSYYGKEIEILAVGDFDVKTDTMETSFSSPKLRCLILVGENPGCRDCVALEYLLFRKSWTQDYDGRFYFVDQKTLKSGDLSFPEGEYHMMWSKSETASFTSPYFLHRRFAVE